MKPFPVLLLLQLLFILYSVPASSAVEIRDKWYWLNGERFFIKAIGYEIGARPGQHPYQDKRTDETERLASDLNHIKNAGFNAIRTWSPFSENQLKLVQASGLKLLMGIDIPPEKDYGNPEFINQCTNRIQNVLDYAAKYDCIITYLILNEPQTDHMHAVTAPSFLNLMQKLIDKIHRAHPGVPVTISANAMISDYLNMNLFDVYAYNCYDHQEAQTATMGMKDFIAGLVSLNGEKKPFIATEFGYSVSQKGFGQYGGNTLEEQSRGLIKNYRDLLDAGATGMCPFYYADGWWKGDDANYHNPDQPEEWFGFWGYSDRKDTTGNPRPVWFALRNYMKGLVLSPRNQGVYAVDTLPVEVYTDADIRKIVIRNTDRTLLSLDCPREGYQKSRVMMHSEKMEDKELIFEFLNAKGEVLKTESIQVLVNAQPDDLPTLTLETTPSGNLGECKKASVKTTLHLTNGFKVAGNLRISYNTHLGWEVGPQLTIPQQDLKEVTERYFDIPDNCWVVNASAGIAVQYGKFVFRIHDQKIVYRDNWARGIGH